MTWFPVRIHFRKDERDINIKRINKKSVHFMSDQFFWFFGSIDTSQVRQTLVDRFQQTCGIDSWFKFGLLKTASLSV